MAGKRSRAGDALDAATTKKRSTRSKRKLGSRDPIEPDRSAVGDEGGKVRVTLYLSEYLWQESRTAVLQIGAAGEHPASLSALVDEAVARELATLRRRFNEGQPFPRHLGGLPGGRPRT
jgi:hypothetical protein